MLEDNGIVVLAQNLDTVDYVQQACLLAMSVSVTNPGTKISIITDNSVPPEYVKLFDKILMPCLTFQNNAIHYTN